MKFIIPGRLSGANEALKAANRHYAIGNTLKRKETNLCARSVIVAKLPKVQKAIRIHFHWVEKDKRRDLDNIRFGAKYILDGMRQAGILPNDGWAWVVSMSDSWDTDKKNPRIEVTVSDEIEI